MFNLNDKVKLKEKTYRNKDYYDLFDEIGTIQHIDTSILDNVAVTYLTVRFDKGSQIRLNADAFTLADPQPLTLTKIQQLKDTLTRDLFKLIQEYEQKTQTHIFSVHLNTATFEGDGVPVNRVVGIRLEVNL